MKARVTSLLWRREPVFVSVGRVGPGPPGQGRPDRKPGQQVQVARDGQRPARSRGEASGTSGCLHGVGAEGLLL